MYDSAAILEFQQQAEHQQHQAQPMVARFRPVEVILIIATVMAFTDESLRKIIPGEPVVITAGKMGLIVLAALLVMMRGLPGQTTPMLTFVPWVLVTFASSVLVALQYDAPKTVPAVLLAYSASPLFMAVGYYIGFRPPLLKTLGRIYLVGGVFAIFIAIAQEFARSSLPAIFAARIYKEKHIAAGGNFNESIFASPQVLAVVMMPLVAWAFMELLAKRSRFNSLWTGALVILVGYTIFLTRIRVAVPLAVVMIMFTLLLVHKTGLKVSTLASRIFMGGLLLSIMFTILVEVVPEDIYSRKGEGDRNFFSKLLKPEETFIRVMFWMGEVRDLPNHSMTFGYGVGTGSRLREIVGDYRLVNVPIVYDTGIAMLYHEMGISGVIAFGVGFVLLPILVFLQLLKMRYVEPAAIASLSVVGAYLGWFLFKHHTVLINGFSHVMWMVMLGICCATLTRGQLAASQPELEQQLDYGAQDEYARIG